MRNTYFPDRLSWKELAAVLLAAAVAVLIVALPVQAQPPFNERDLYSERMRQFHGTGLNVGDRYILGVQEKHLYSIVSFKMNKDRALYIEIDPLTKPASVVMMVSQPSSLRDMKVVWADNDLKDTIRLWTNQFWVPVEKCNFNVCPKISFRVRGGVVSVKILDRRPEVVEKMWQIPKKIPKGTSQKQVESVR